MWVPVSAWQSFFVDPTDLVEQAPPGQLTPIRSCRNSEAATATRRCRRSTTPADGHTGSRDILVVYVRWQTVASDRCAQTSRPALSRRACPPDESQFLPKVCPPRLSGLGRARRDIRAGPE